MGLGAGIWRRLIVLGLAVSVSGVPLSFGQTAASSGFLSGRIFVADGVTPRPGVVVKAANLSTSQVYASTQTDKSGRYAFADLPSGRYQIAVETGEGLYVNEDLVPVLQGRKTLFSLALNPGSVQEEPPPPAPETPPEPETPPAPETPPEPETPPPSENPPVPEPPQEAEPPAPEPAPEVIEPPAAEQPAETPQAEEKEKEKKSKKEKKEKAATEDESGRKKGGGFWRSGWGVAVGLGGGAIVLGLLADSIAGDTAEVEEPPSPSTPE